MNDLCCLGISKPNPGESPVMSASENRGRSGLSKKRNEGGTMAHGSSS